jgi:hypothetical protein
MGEGHTSGNKLSVYEAADAMGVAVDAIRKRVSRGTIPYERDEDGRVWILLDTDRDTSGNVRDNDRLRSDSSALISEMRDRLRYVEGQLEAECQAHAEARRIIAGLVERIPALEAPQTAQQEPERIGPRSAAPSPQDATQPRPWWSRMFGR